LSATRATPPAAQWSTMSSNPAHCRTAYERNTAVGNTVKPPCTHGYLAYALAVCVADTNRVPTDRRQYRAMRAISRERSTPSCCGRSSGGGQIRRTGRHVVRRAGPNSAYRRGSADIGGGMLCRQRLHRLAHQRARDGWATLNRRLPCVSVRAGYAFAVDLSGRIRAAFSLFRGQM
jgi:hypothetical protein